MPKKRASGMTPEMLENARKRLGMKHGEFAKELGYGNGALISFRKGRVEIPRTAELAVKGLLFERVVDQMSAIVVYAKDAALEDQLF